MQRERNENVVKKEIKKKLMRVAKDYSKYGVTFDDCVAVYNSGIANGINARAAVVGLRFGLSKVYNTHEYFTIEDVAAVTGETVEQVTKRIEDNKEELMQDGSIIEVSSTLSGLFQ